MTKKIAIIGGGIGGLSASIYLSSCDFQVDIYEKNNSLGGKANQIAENGFRFDTGPSLVTMPFVIEEVFKVSKESINNYLELKKLEILCNYFFDDHSKFTAYSDIDKLSHEFERFTQLNKRLLLDYLAYTKKIYNLTSEIFLFNSLFDWKKNLNFRTLYTLFNLPKIDPFRTMHEANWKFFKQVKFVQLLDRYATYNGSNPYKAPATLNIIQHVEYNLGGFTINGGIYRLIKAFEQLARKNGVKIYTGNKVEKILTTNKTINGIQVKGEKIPYDIVLSNADVLHTFELLNDFSSKEYLKNLRLEPSSSAIVFYWGINKTTDLDFHNILFSKNYEKEFYDIFTLKMVPDDPTIYIHISSKVNKNDAPEDYENWFVLVNTPPNYPKNLQIDIEKLKAKIIDKVKKLTGINLNDSIVFEKILTPDLIEKNTSSKYGSIYGASSNSRYSAFLRQANFSRTYKNLFFCGGSAHPGGGIPLVILSGKIASNLIKRKFNDRSKT